MLNSKDLLQRVKNSPPNPSNPPKVNLYLYACIAYKYLLTNSDYKRIMNFVFVHYLYGLSNSLVAIYST